MKRLIVNYTLIFFVIKLADALAIIIDQLIVSRFLGAKAMAAIGLSSPESAILSLLCSVFAIGMQTICSAALGAGDREKPQAAFSTSLVIMGVIAVVAAVCGFVFSPQISVVFGASKNDTELYTSLYRYLRGNAIGIPGYMGFFLLSPLVSLDGNRKCVAAATIVSNVGNVIGDLLSVTVLNLGIFGVGLFTGISWLVAVGVLLTNFFRKDSLFKFRIQKLDFGCLFEMIRIGTPRLTRYMSKILSRLFVNRIIILFGGSIAMSAMSVDYSLTSFFFVIGLGVSECINLCTQLIYNEKNRGELVRMARITLRMMIPFTILLAVIASALAKFIAMLFIKDDPELLALTTSAIVFLAMAIPLNAINTSVISYLQGSRKITLTNLMSLMHRFICSAASAFVLGYFFGIKGIFASFPVSEILVTLVYLSIALIQGRKKKNLIDKLMFIPEDYESQVAASVSFSVANMQEVVTVSEQITRFMKEQNYRSSKTTYYAALCLEELAGNAVRHGFIQDNKEHSCDIRVMIEKNDDVVLRIRDNCPLFNLKERYEVIRDSDFISNIGIKLVYGIADDVKYINLLGLNTLIIRLKPHM